MGANVDWGGTDRRVHDNMGRYPVRVMDALMSVAQFYVPQLESYAKTNRVWTDQTSNARQGLHSFAVRDDEKVHIFLSHGVDYGIWLELANAGKYAIILVSLQAHYSMIMSSVRAIFKR